MRPGIFGQRELKHTLPDFVTQSSGRFVRIASRFGWWLEHRRMNGSAFTWLDPAAALCGWQGLPLGSNHRIHKQYTTYTALSTVRPRAGRAHPAHRRTISEDAFATDTGKKMENAETVSVFEYCLCSNWHKVVVRYLYLYGFLLTYCAPFLCYQ